MKNNIENWTEQKIKRRTFFSFAAFALAGAGGVLGWNWFRNLPKNEQGLAKPTREILSFNEKWNDAFYSNQHLAPTYPKSDAAKRPRVNGDIGVEQKVDLKEWELEIVNPVTNQSEYLDMDDIKSLPKEAVVFDFKCIEGWNEVVNYGGVKLSGFLKKYNLGFNNSTKELFKYVGMETPDGTYYVGLDMKSAMHPQTLLCYEMNDLPLPENHGAPLRLIIPVKYGVKNLKRIGKIFFSDLPPRDYWHESGYEYDAAL